MNAETPKLLNVISAAQLLGVSVSYLNKARMTPGAGPRFVKFGTRCAYDPADLAAWVETQKRTSTGGESNSEAAR
jgi:hypothetical protein